MLILLSLISVSFILTQTDLVRIPGFSRFIDSLTGSYEWSAQSSYSAFQSALAKAEASSSPDSFLGSFVRGVGSALPSQQSSLPFVVGGREIVGDKKIIGLAGKKRTIKGIASPGDNITWSGAGDDIMIGRDLKYGDLAGVIDGKGGMSYPSSGIHGEGGGHLMGPAIASSFKNIPNPGKPSPSRISGKKTGKVLAFTWRNYIFNRQKTHVGSKRLGSNRKFFRLGETYATTKIGESCSGCAFEARETYVGSTYDGTSLDLDLLDVDGEVEVPDPGDLNDPLDDIDDLGDAWKKCQDAQAKYNPDMTRLADDMERLSCEMQPGMQPKCDSGGARDEWNRKAAQLQSDCEEYNRLAVALAAECGVTASQRDCTYRQQMNIKKCKKPSGAMMIFMFLLFLLLLIMLAVLVAVIAIWAGLSILAGIALGAGTLIVSSLIAGSMISGAISALSGLADTQTQMQNEGDSPPDCQ